MKVQLYFLLGTSLSFLPTLSLAQCVETTNCETLGYTETSCDGGKGVKCPFGNKWACLSKDTCEASGFKYTCSGSGYAGANGDSCGGKYKKCNCAGGYIWDSNQGCVVDACAGYQYCEHGCRGSDTCGGKCKSCLTYQCDYYFNCECTPAGWNYWLTCDWWCDSDEICYKDFGTFGEESTCLSALKTAQSQTYRCEYR